MNELTITRKIKQVSDMLDELQWGSEEQDTTKLAVEIFHIYQGDECDGCGANRSSWKELFGNEPCCEHSKKEG
jgi:hypothetical protein